MKRATLFLLSLSSATALITTAGFSQGLTDAQKRLSNGGRGGSTTGLGGATIPSTQRRVTTTYITYISNEREWKDAKGRTMNGRLVAFSAPKPGEKGQVVVIKDGKVRLRRTGAKVNSDLPIELLSNADQTFIKALDAGLQKRMKEAAAADNTTTTPKSSASKGSAPK